MLGVHAWRMEKYLTSLNCDTQPTGASQLSCSAADVLTVRFRFSALIRVNVILKSAILELRDSLTAGISSRPVETTVFLPGSM